jgi:hypothetical protein
VVGVDDETRVGALRFKEAGANQPFLTQSGNPVPQLLELENVEVWPEAPHSLTASIKSGHIHGGLNNTELLKRLRVNGSDSRTGLAR